MIGDAPARRNAIGCFRSFVLHFGVAFAYRHDMRIGNDIECARG